MAELAYVNGIFCPVHEAKVSIDDRGYQFGDGIYEVVVAYSGQPFLWDRHMERFRQSAEAIGLEFDFRRTPLEPLVREGIRRCGLQDVLVYMQITRGTAPRSHAIPPGLTPNLVMTFRPLPRVPDEQRRRGARVITTLDTRWANCYIKATTLLPNVLARKEAIRRGCDDAIFVTHEGEVRECTSANVFAVTEGRVHMPPRNESVLHGITQGFLLECAEGVGIPVIERTFDVKLLRSADEVFMSSTTVEVFAITSIDNQPVGDGKVGPVATQLLEEYRARARGLRPLRIG